MSISGVSSSIACVLILATTVPASGADKVYWSWPYESSFISRANLDGSNVELVVDTGGRWVAGMDVDPIGGKLYWTEGQIDRIRRANLDGSNVETVISNLFAPSGIDLDLIGAKIYWADQNGHVYRANLDGTEMEDLLNGPQLPWGFALGCGKMFWTSALDCTIRRANLDGSLVQTIVSYPGYGWTIAADIEDEKLYWTDNLEAQGHYVYRSNLDGSNVTMVLENPMAFDLAFDAAHQKIYWTTGTLGVIRRANLDGSNIETVLTADHPRAIALTVEPIPCGDCTLGDMNGDGWINAGDIDEFVATLLDPDGVSRDAFCTADMNRSATVNAEDIAPFLAIVVTDIYPPSPNPMTWDTPSTAISTSELTMAATEATDSSPPVEYFFLYWPGDGAGGNSRFYDPSRTHTDDGLDTNTVYTYSAKARDSASPRNYTADSAPGSAATHIETPSGLVAGTSTPSSIEVTATSDAGGFTNLAVPSSGLFFKCWQTTGGDPNNPVAQSGWTTNTTWTATGLQSGTQYTIAVQARNQDTIETIWFEADFTTQ